MKNSYIAEYMFITIGFLIYLSVSPDIFPEEKGEKTETVQQEESVATAGSISVEDYKRLKQKLGELEMKVKKMEVQEQKSLLEKLREEAKKEAEEAEAEKKEEIWFKGGARSLQALNPELTINGDFLVKLYMHDNLHQPYYDDEGGEWSGFNVRLLGLHFQSNLDPYSFFKAAVAFHEGHFGLGEGYMTWTGAIKRVNITVGKFRQQFGVINRWHLHGLDQVDFPRSIQTFFGEGGLNQTGVSFRILLPKLWAHANELTVQITNSENKALFAGGFWTVPSVLGHLKNYYDLSPSTYLEIGLSGIWGFNNRRGVEEVDGEETGEKVAFNEPWRNTVVAGIDLTFAWEPLEMAKYKWFVWRTEAMYLHKETEEGDINVFGGFTYFDVRVSQIFVFGGRVDFGQEPAVSDPVKYVQASPYLTLWQSHWVKLRLQYNYLWKDDGSTPQHLLLFQIDWSAGPHKHEKY